MVRLIETTSDKLTIAFRGYGHLYSMKILSVILPSSGLFLLCGGDKSTQEQDISKAKEY
ncbi:hypothetical protein [Microcoleus sp. FACHB-831]|uniref:hypothetical protein n=1 Tax=Microcoleus sp. FACHB-831 TaxID=2692827 RepID=UPI001F549122|nr:hypothetical protein [Microcoleus sp. FACHB-831]